jgi:hypothetical protein
MVCRSLAEDLRPTTSTRVVVGRPVFHGLATNNAVLFLDRVSWLEMDLSLVRAALGAVAGLVFAIALAWDTR